MSELLVVGLQMLAVFLMVFGLGALSGWHWAVRSLRRPPAWITVVVATAGASSAAAFALQAEWLSASLIAFVYLTIVAGHLGWGPFARSRDEAA